MAERIRFYNLLAHINTEKGIREENVALKNIWEHSGNIMLDLYFYQDKISKVIDSSYIKDIIDLATEKQYNSCRILLQDFATQTKTTETKNLSKEESNSLRLFSPLQDDITILLFIAKCAGNFSVLKQRSILGYIKKYHPKPKSLSRTYVESCIKSLSPSEEDFYKALENVSRKTPKEAEILAQEVVKICLSEGLWAYQEKLYIAEILYVLRQQGVEPNIGL